jgi:CheY-like chemotaxis protein/anti-sigma regulatory factor (Ser/Thr protein kinase)
MDFRTFIYDALKSPNPDDTTIPVKRLQTIHLKNAKKQMNYKSPKLYKALQQVSETLGGLSFDRRSIMTRDWKPLSQESEKLGLEKIHWFFYNIGQLKEQPGYLELIDIELLERNFRKYLSELDDSIHSLGQFGFFDMGKDDAGQNLLENKHVLIVEDMPYNRILLKKILQRYNCTIAEAVDGQIAIDRWKETPSFDLVIMDMNMPVMDGFAATRTIRQLETEQNLKRTPIVALTALAMRGDREKCLEAGCDEYMTKPVETNILIDIGRQLLGGTGIESGSSDPQKSVHIQKVLLKTDNQVYDYILASVLGSMGIVFDRISDLGEILESLAEDRIDFLILEAETDLPLAFYVKNHFPDKYVILITTGEHAHTILCEKSENNIQYPFTREDISTVLQHCSQMQRQALKQAENIADADSLSKIKGQGSIKEAVQKSNRQLAVWQKAFRKIGGDLVLSHQFDLHGKYGFILGDVAGHDIQSGYTASWFAGLVKGVWGQYSNPYDLLRYLNSFLDHDAEEEDKRFVCALVLLWDPLRNKLHFANAGIPGGILVKKSTGKATLIKWTGIPIGMFPEMDMFDHDEIDFMPGDRLYVATDGVLEAIPSEIISDIGETKSNQPPQQALESIVDFVKRSIEVTDDLTIAVFEGHPFEEPESGFRQTIRSTNDELEVALKQIEDYLNREHPERFDMLKVSMAVREALINALEHGNINVFEKPIDIDLEILDNILEIRVSDCGGGFDLMSEKYRLQEEGELRIHGRGIELMENICHSLSFTGSGVCMAFEEKPLSEELPSDLRTDEN